MDQQPTFVHEWCRARLGSRPQHVLFEVHHLSHVTGYRLQDGRDVVVKLRLANRRVGDCVQVQRHLADQGFPCAKPLTPAEIIDRWTVHAEECKPLGIQLRLTEDAPGRFAAALVWLVREAPAPSRVAALPDPLPWVGWNHHEPGLWPAPDDLSVDLNRHPGPGWLDSMAAAVRKLLATESGPLIVGHGDWESQNLRWIDENLYCVHDFDSAVIHSEPAIAGAAAAVFTSNGQPGTEPSTDESARFLEAYQRERGVQWRSGERRVAWAAGLWVRAFNAKKELVSSDGRPASNLRSSLEERLARSGLSL